MTICGKRFFTAVSTCAVLISAVLLTGCSPSAKKAAADPADLSCGTSGSSTGEYFDLSANGQFEISKKPVGDSLLVIDEAFYTNSQTISVTNNGDSSVEVYLLQKDDPEHPIQQLTLANNSSQTFTNLTSRFLYQIGISTAADSNIRLTISA